MFLRSLRSSSSLTPLYAPENELGTEGAEVVETKIPLNELPADGPGSGRSKLRKDLEKNFETDRTRRAKEDASEKQVRKTKVGINHQEAEVEEEAGDEGTPEGKEATPVEGADEAGEDAAKAEPTWAPPEGWPKEAKAEAAKIPPAVQAAITKRETDVAKGVAALQQRYTEIDQALQPHMDAIRQHGHTPGQAVNQLFMWFKALRASPDEAFPALMKSFNYDPKKLLEGQAKEGTDGKPTQGEQPAGDVPPAVQDYINKLEQRQQALEQAIGQKFGALENTFAEQSFAKTNDILRNWSKDKPHFEDIRMLMAHLIGSGAVAPLEDGSADLDKAYDMALYAMPEVRAKVLAEQSAKAAAERKAKADAEKKAQQAAAEKARKTGVSITGGAPGAAVASQGKAKKGKSVRESIEEARRELAE